MTPSSRGPAYHPFMVTAETVALDRPDVDPDMAREVFEEAATLLHNGLVLDGLERRVVAQQPLRRRRPPVSGKLSPRLRPKCPQGAMKRERREDLFRQHQGPDGETAADAAWNHRA